MKTSALILQLTEVMNAFGDPLIVVPSYVENRYEAVQRIEVTEMVLCAHEGAATKASGFRTRDASEPVTAAIVLRGAR